MNRTTQRASSVQLAVIATPSTSLAEAVAEARRLQRTATASIARATARLRSLRIEGAAAGTYYRTVLTQKDALKRTALPTIGVLAALGGATILVGALEAAFRLGNASSVYLLAVVAIAIAFGTAPAIATAIGGFLAYNFLFVEPRYTFTVGRADELLTLVLLLFVGVVIGRLAGLQRDREHRARLREQEARALFGISRQLATSDRLSDAIQTVVERVASETGMARVWVGLGATVAHERVVADSGGSSVLLPPGGTHAVLQRDREEGAAIWTRISPPDAPTNRGASATQARRNGLFRVALGTAGETVGSLWAERESAAREPKLEETRLLAATADQLGQAVRRERLLAQASELEIARRSDELKSALVDSVSHDLRTPLAAIRAAAGSLADPAIDLSEQERRRAASAIDAEADRLNRLVGDLLDMSRIQGGALVADIEIIPLHELVLPAVERARPRAQGRPIDLELPADLPSVRADAALLDQVIANLLDNAVRYAGEEASIRVRGHANPDRTVSLVVEDSGDGVLDEDLPRLFDRFFRVAPAVPGRRRGFGLGLSVVKGLVEVMGGSVSAVRSSMGGLAVTVVLPAEAVGSGDS